MNPQQKKGLELIKEGITILLGEEVESVESSTVAKADVSTDYVGDLTQMTYNNLKKLANQLGIPAVGSRDELTVKIQSALNDEEVEVVEEEAEVVAEPKKSGRGRKAGSKNVKKEEPVEEAEVVEEEADEEDIEAMVKDAVSAMTDEEIADLLTSYEISVKGKNRSAMTKEVVKAVKAGVIEFNDDDETEVMEEEDSEDDTRDEVVEVADSEEIDFNNPEDMTEERIAACEKLEEEVNESIDSGDITRESLIEWLNEYHDAEVANDLSDEELVEQYLNLSKLFVNDEGETMEEGAYLVNDTPFCCGRPLNHVDNEFVCENCGETYSDEEE